MIGDICDICGGGNFCSMIDREKGWVSFHMSWVLPVLKLFGYPSSLEGNPAIGFSTLVGIDGTFEGALS